MQLFKNGNQVDSYQTSYSGRNIYISIDSSKSNSAMFVWDENSRPLDDYEISGAGADIDVYDLCYQTRQELKKLFYGANILKVGIEDIITKNEKGYKGLEIHQSRYKITAVFDSFIFYFQEYHHIMPIKINNWEWKSHILPEEYRTRDHKKGSKEWCVRLGNRWADRKDDVTDAYCIGLYLTRTEHVEVISKIEGTEPAKYEYEYIICPSSTPLNNSNIKHFTIQNNDTIIHNIETVSNRINNNMIGAFNIPISSIPIDLIYNSNIRYTDDHRFEKEDTEVTIIVSRK